MNKKIVSTIALSLLVTQVAPYVAYAQPVIDAEVTNNIKEKSNIDWSKEYKDLTIPEKKDMKPVVYSAETMLELSNIITLLDELDTDFSMDKLNEVFERIFKLNTNISEEDALLHQKYDQIDYIMYRATYFAFTKQSGKERDNYFTKLADDMYLSSLKRHNSGIPSYLMADYGVYYGSVIGKYFESKRTQEILIYLNSLLQILKNTSIIPPDHPEADDNYDYTYPEDELPSTIKPDNSGDDDTEFLPEEIPPLPSIPNDPVKPEDDSIVFPDINDENYYQYSEEYVRKGNSCYKVTTKYDFVGNQVDKKEQLLPSSQKGYCNIFNYNVIEGDSWNQNNNGDIALEVWESLGQNELNKLSNYSIHFSINKDKENPYYYDSGIRVSTNNTVTYTQLRDVLSQISLKIENGYLIEDSDKLLFIAEGKPLVVKDKKSEYSKKEVEELFNSFETIGLKIDKIKQLNYETEEVTESETSVENETE